jgi:hypothetical protein
MKEYRAILIVKVKQPDKYEGMDPIDYLTTHVTDEELGVTVVDVKIEQSEAS